MSEQRSPIPPDWYDGFFDVPEWLDLLATPIPIDETERQATFLQRELDLEPGARVLDLACGHGRISLELARRGYHVTGLDLSAPSLERAREAAAAAGVDVEWVHADMRALPEGREWDAVVSVCSAFGYFVDDDNRRVVEAVARALRPGGRFLVDVLNLLWLARHYQPRRWDTLEGGVLHLEQARYDFLHGRSDARWTFVHPDGRRTELGHTLRLYAPHELRALLEDAGLHVTGAWGSYDGTDLSFDSPRLILRAERPATLAA